MLIRYRENRSIKPFSVPRALYGSREMFYYLIDSKLIVLDRNYYYSNELSDEDIEKYVNFLKDNNIYIPNRDNFIKNPKLLKSIIENNIVDQIDSFKKEAWTKDNIKLLINKGLTIKTIPNPLYDSSEMLKYCINNNMIREINNFNSETWTEENIELFLKSGIIDEIDLSSTLLDKELVLNHLLKNENLREINRFNDSAWTENNISLFKRIILESKIDSNQFPVTFRFNPKALEFCLNNGLNDYLDVFLKGAFTKSNIELLKSLLITENKIIDHIPKELNGNNELLKFCIQNNLIDYILTFESNAWKLEDAVNYINSFENDEDILFSRGIKRSKYFMHAIMFMDKLDLLEKFSYSCWTLDYCDMLFEIIATKKGNMKLKNDLLERYKSLKTERIKLRFIRYIINNRENFGNLDDIAEVLEALENSNSSELRHISSEIASLVLSKDNPMETFKKIEKIYLSNELPDIAKIYNVFRTFHTNSDGSIWFNDNPNISPVLKHYSNGEKGRMFSEVIIFSDLLKIYAGSNNRSLINYLKKLKKSNELFIKIESGLSLENISENEIKNLNSYLVNLTAIYNQTLKGKKNPYILTGNIKIDIENLKNLYNIIGEKNILDRVVRMYSNFIGISSYDEMMEYIDNKTREADARGRTLEKEPFTVEKGDFIKGINDISFLPNILNNGIVASEFLGSSARKSGDLTPLDTDGSIAQKSGPINQIFDNRSLAAFFYGRTWLVSKTKDRTIITRENDFEEEKPKYDREKIELFQTGANGTDHYGIRTGYPSTDIDYIVTEEYSPKMGFEIARNGFYIPVLDTKGNLLFTSNEFDSIRSQMNGLSHYGIDSYQFSDNLILPNIEETIEEMENDSKVEIIKKLVESALKQYNLLMRDKLDGNLSRNIFNFIDIGSTGRGTNVKGKTDYDFIILLDQKIINDEELLNKIKKSIRSALKKEVLSDKDNIYNGNFRFKNVEIESDIMDIDISFEGKTDKITYSSDMAIKDRLQTMEKSSKEKTLLAKANIITAKKILKKAGVYKPINSEEREGGLGGIGIENWILSHGGSLIDASISFISAYEEAYNNSETKSDKDIFERFNTIYKIWNFGENYFSLNSEKALHNEFINENLSPHGLKKMQETLKHYLKTIDISIENEKNIQK